MISIISPAKTLDFESTYSFDATKPRLLSKTAVLSEVLKKKSPPELETLMGISEKLATLNVQRFQEIKKSPTAHNGKPCSLAFKGDVYIGLQAEDFDEGDMAFAQNHLRILSGFYGLLRPMDLIQPYRLEMGTKLAFDDYTTLYDYWDNEITELLMKDLRKQEDDIVINLASNEYFKAIKRKEIKARIIDVEFKDFKNGQYKVISFFAKKARGMMSRFMIKNRIKTPEGLLAFEDEGYRFDTNTSETDKLVFLRD